MLKCMAEAAEVVGGDLQHYDAAASDILKARTCSRPLMRANTGGPSSTAATVRDDARSCRASRPTPTVPSAASACRGTQKESPVRTLDFGMAGSTAGKAHLRSRSARRKTLWLRAVELF